MSGAATEVLIATESGLEETRATLRKLAQEENTNPGTEMRKWRLVLLQETIKNLPADPLYALLALTEFWERFDFPVDGPHTVQGRYDDVSPAEYYSQANCELLLRKHAAWIAGELTALRSMAA